jgi:hypothetical protein
MWTACFHSDWTGQSRGGFGLEARWGRSDVGVREAVGQGHGRGVGARGSAVGRTRGLAVERGSLWHCKYQMKVSGST